MDNKTCAYFRTLGDHGWTQNFSSFWAIWLLGAQIWPRMHLKCATNCCEWETIARCCHSVWKCNPIWGTPIADILFAIVCLSPFGYWYEKIPLKYSWRGGCGTFKIFPYYIIFTFLWISRKTPISWYWIQGISTPLVTPHSPRESTNHSLWSQQR